MNKKQETASLGDMFYLTCLGLWVHNIFPVYHCELQLQVSFAVKYPATDDSIKYGKEIWWNII